MTSRMTATDELRRLLDERGVEWRDDSSIYGTRRTVWTADGVTYVAAEVSGRLKVSGYLIPEQAVDATLGRGTCHAIISDNLTESEGMGDAWADCSECGHLLFVLTDPNSEPPNFCPNCGRRIVEVDA